MDPVLGKTCISSASPTGPLLPQVVVLTGASSGLGEALAHKLYAAGCRLILLARRLDQLERVKQDVMLAHQVSQGVSGYWTIDLAGFQLHLGWMWRGWRIMKL